MNYEAIELVKKMPIADRALYNGKTPKQIEKLLPATWAVCHKSDYMYNVCRVIECQISQTNLHEIEALKNYNFNLVKFYMN